MDGVIYATNPEWLGTLYQPEKGEVYIMSEDGVMGATCIIGSLQDEDGKVIPVPEDLEEIQRKYCRMRNAS